VTARPALPQILPVLLAALALVAGAAACGGEAAQEGGVGGDGERGGSRDTAGEPRLGDRPVPEGTTLVAALGDSITAGSPLWDPDRAIRAQLGSTVDPRSQYEYWAQRRLDGVRFRNCGVAGERTDQIGARLEGCARGADVLIVQGGVNDIAQARSPEEAAANLRAMVRRGRRSGLRVALVEVLPWNNGYPRAAEPISELNRLIGAIGDDLDVPVYPWYEALEDPAAPGRMRGRLTIEGDHPSIAGYRRLAQSVKLP
jgi:lysophospholipase L1-like esterase